MSKLKDDVYLLFGAVFPGRFSCSVKRLKFEMKRATGAEKWRLTEQYKEGKQNFTFKTPGNADLDYCIKNGNAIIRYTLQPAP